MGKLIRSPLREPHNNPPKTTLGHFLKAEGTVCCSESDEKFSAKCVERSWPGLTMWLLGAPQLWGL